MENVGSDDELTFADSGGAAKVTATITGYSTQVTDGDISGRDGTAGQVLTDTGVGAAWGDVASSYSDYESTFRVTGTTSLVSAASVTVPAGEFFTIGSVTVYDDDATNDFINCALVSPSGNHIDYVHDYVFASNSGGSVTLNGVLDTTGGSVSLQCEGSGAVDAESDASLDVISLARATGSISN